MSKRLWTVPFYQAPVRWIWNVCVYPHLPLMWKVRCANAHLDWLKFRREKLDQILGPLEPMVFVASDWHVIARQERHYRYRDVEYVLKRRRLPWASTKKKWGTQCCDEEAHPVRLQDHKRLADVAENIYAISKRYNDHSRLREQLKNPVEVNKA